MERQIKIIQAWNWQTQIQLNCSNDGAGWAMKFFPLPLWIHIKYCKHREYEHFQVSREKENLFTP